MNLTRQDHEELLLMIAAVQTNLLRLNSQVSDLRDRLNVLNGARFDRFDDMKQPVCSHQTPIGDYCPFCVEIHDTPEG